jgi:hypothetical protein
VVSQRLAAAEAVGFITRQYDSNVPLLLRFEDVSRRLPPQLCARFAWFLKAAIGKSASPDLYCRMDVVERARAFDILEFWHRIEYFRPFDLDEIIEDPDRQVRILSAEELHSAAAEKIWWGRLQHSERVWQFHLYLGVFDKSEVTNLYEAGRQGEDVWLENQQRADLEGRSCFAKLKFSPQGTLQLDSLSISTVPWAIGVVRQDGWSQLSEDRFESDLQRLHDRLRSWLNEREEINEAPAERGSERPLTGPRLLQLGELFYDWAHFRPEGQPLAVLDVQIRSSDEAEPNAQPVAAKITMEQGAPPMSNFAPAGPVGGRSEIVVHPSASNEMPLTNGPASDDEDEHTEESQEVDILNSFYLRDLERVMRALRAGEDMPTVAGYLQGRPRSDRVNLYQTGLDAIREALQPRHLNQGRWLDKPTNRMSLMQQFAINQSRRLLRDKGLFSVNGPPGTGKTTLLRDLIADILVQRATALAEYHRSTDAFFTEPMRVTFPGETRASKLVILRPSIVGHEVVVASTNNVAVENISEDLPKQKSIDSVFASVAYLQTVAHKVAAEKENGSYAVLGRAEVPWGLIAGVLGRKRNRRKFVDRLSFKGSLKNQPKLVDKSDLKFQTIYDWIDSYQGLTFQDAKEAFRSKLQEVTTRINRLQRLTELSSEFACYRDESSFLATEIKRVRDAEKALHESKERIRLCIAELDGLQRSLTQAREEERLINRAAPHLLLRWIPFGQACKYRARKRENAEDQLRWNRLHKERYRILEDQLRPDEQDRTQKLKATQDELAERRLCWLKWQEEIRTLKAEFPDAVGLRSAEDLESDRVQIDGLWYDETLNRLRSDLFATALDLHQSWVAEVGRKGVGFRANIFGAMKLLGDELPDKPEAVSLLWQSLFMIVPVVSTTFASVGRQFRGLGGGALGWLFIDEAGQAVPQAAVGALWRARRTLVVGDPLQIEPVFTVPAGMIERLASLRSGTQSVCFWPHKSSVQRLADLANQYGADVSVADP